MPGLGVVSAERTPSSSARIGFAAILAAFLALATLQSFATRLQWGPDEPAHIIYVRSLAMSGRLPHMARSQTDEVYRPDLARTHQAQHPPLYYALAAGVWRIFSHLPDATVSYVESGTGELLSFQVPGPVRPVRMFSVLLGAITLAFAWAAGRTVFPNRPAVCLAGVALVAFTPMFTYLHGVISNDPLLICFLAATAWQWARIMRRGASKRDILVLGVVVGAAINTKETALALIPLSFVVIALEPGARSWRQRVWRMAALAAVAVVLAGWWYVRNLLLYRELTAYAYCKPFWELPEEQRSNLLVCLPSHIFLFAAVPADVVLPHANLAVMLIGFGLAGVLSVGGVALVFMRYRRQAIPAIEVQSVAVWLLAAVVVLAGVIYKAVCMDWRVIPTGGRYLQPVLPLWGLASARGLSALFAEGRAARAALTIACLVFLAVNIYAIWATAAGYQTLGFQPPAPR